ncbi:hypothetical protein SO802_027960 [Lithocarpus litseifolius]|uniref:DUF1279 domain-containing protein n=1 Tax=Lithocarpus litseifolius TaxID=425828 RepID=A0AAW2BNW0_9ROSI
MAFRELLKKYGKVALGVHFTVSAASISGLYIAIKNNLDVESFLQNFHINPAPPKPPSEPNPQAQTSSSSSSPDGLLTSISLLEKQKELAEYSNFYYVERFSLDRDRVE